jgi:diacylglycerol kinase family enzyme
MKRVLVLLNARAGTLIDAGTRGVVRQLKSTLADRCESLDVRLLRPRDIRGAIEYAARGPHDTVIVGGGDGSVSTAVAAFANNEKQLGVLPLGTMNLLARDLGMPRDPHEAVAALHRIVPHTIDLAEINGRPAGEPATRVVARLPPYEQFYDRHRDRRPARTRDGARRARH